MPISKKDSETIVRLASEGKRINRIHRDYLPHLSYGEIQAEAGGKNAIGVKRMITAGIDAIAASNDSGERETLAKKLKSLTGLLYSNHKQSHEKLTKIREALDA